jgi:transposase
MPKRRFTREFKLEAVQEVLRGTRSLSAIARDLGISPNLLSLWKKQLAQEGEEAFPGKGNLKSEDAEIKKLEREVRRLRQENEFLKKATAFFAKERERGSS